MCLAVPGKITTIYKNSSPKMAKIEFGGISKQICLDFLPNAKEGNYVLVHVGFALSIVDEKEAAETMKMFAEIDSKYISTGSGGADEIC